MNYKKYLAFILILISIFLISCSIKPNQKPNIKVQDNATYITEDKQIIKATYYTLSDDSLEFVKLVLPNGEKYTLPRLLSASGVRYSNDYKLVWWIKGSVAFCEERLENGEWKIKYKNCVKQ